MFHSSTRNCRPHTPERVIQAGLVLRNAALTAELQATTDKLRASRRRLVEAQDAERRKIERNLRDGAQQQLIAVTIPAAPSRSAHGPETGPP